MVKFYFDLIFDTFFRNAVLFLNTYKFITHPRVIYLDSTSDMYFKTKFINTCDAMLHARMQGESFGLSVLEFACKNKHIITYGDSRERSHLSYLDKNCSIYREENDLFQILKTITTILIYYQSKIESH